MEEKDKKEELNPEETVKDTAEENVSETAAQDAEPEAAEAQEAGEETPDGGAEPASPRVSVSIIPGRQAKSNTFSCFLEHLLLFCSCHKDFLPIFHSSEIRC